MKITASAPMRIGLLGGGTDVAPYSDQYGGVCLSMAINLRQHLVLDTQSDGESSYPVGGDPKFYQAFFDQMDFKSQFYAACDGEITGGLGSSASAAVALVGAIAKAKGIKYDKDEIAQAAWMIEVHKAGLFGGKQDQWAAARGGVNLFEFKKGRVTTTDLGPTFISPVLPSILLFYTGKNRRSDKIQEGLEFPTEKQIRALDLLKAYTLEGTEAIVKRDIKRFSEMVTLSWEAKKNSNVGVSTPLIDSLFAKARNLGALGGKCLGAGGGGYCFFIVEPEKQAEFKKKIGIDWVDFEIDWNGLSTRIL